MTYEGIRLKLLKQYRLRFAVIRKKQLMNTDFTVIIVPEQCSYIGERAFAECVSLFRIKIPQNCTVAPNAFEDSPNVVIEFY